MLFDTNPSPSLSDSISQTETGIFSLENTNKIEPRTLITSMRGFHQEVFRSAEYEFEDIISHLENANITTLEAAASTLGNHFKKKFANYLGLTFKKNHFLNAGCQPIQIQKKHDIFFFVCQHFWDLTTLNSIQNWRKNSRYAVAWIDEIWACELLNSKTKLCIELLKNFDYVFTTQSASTDAIAKLINRPCIFLPYGVDALKFSPYPHKLERSIYVYSIGRRSPQIHQHLLELSHQKDILYIYDSLKVLQMYNYQEHRELYSNLIKRSRYYIANKAKFDQPQQTGGQEEIGSRFFEGAAGGSVMIGIPPQCQVFQQNFDWEDAVIPISPDTDNIVEILAELDAQPQRLERIRRENVINSLLRHDWVYRWQKILDFFDVSINSAMQTRINYLRNLANSIHS